ncbi:VanZ family protein [Leeuwenhoekiella sp. W20_SRS_FM14]|uniref:VanZ family protein n=1 Tax=Leeuwenhoekiella sp. W20_SRS_FM14 TaxID=3240270 RepID=UPI003F977FF5
MGKFLKPAAYAYTLFIAVICLMPMPHVSNAPKDSDKVIHLLVYFLFTLTWFLYYFLRAKTENFKQSLFKCAGLALIYGILIEVVQEVATVSRSADFKDLIANSIGILTGVILIIAMKSQFLRLKSKF